MKNDYEINGNEVTIFMANGLTTVISIKDLPKLLGIDCRWYGRFDKKSGNYYVASNFKKDGKHTNLLLHRVITGCPKGLQVDHINWNTLDNTKNNLRVCTHAENQQNRKPSGQKGYYKKITNKSRQENKSGIKWVAWRPKRKEYEVRVKQWGEIICVGYYKHKRDARKASNLIYKFLLEGVSIKKEKQKGVFDPLRTYGKPEKIGG